MRMILFFDLPTISDDDMREYRKFRNVLIKNGFVMLQESVYTKILLNLTGVKTMAEKLTRLKPKSGLVQILTVTEKQFGSIINLVGEIKSPYIIDDRRLVLLENDDETN